jgi:hypothetical protein
MFTKFIKININIFISFLFFAFFVLFQLYFFFHYLDVDVASYYVQIQKNQLFHPHHLLYNVLGYFWLKLNQWTQLSNFFLLKLMNLLAGALGTSILYFIFYSYSKKTILSILFVFYVIFSFDYLFYSQINDTAFMPLFFNLIFILFIVLIKEIKIYHIILLSILHTISIGFHQTNLFLIFVGIFKIFSLKKRRIIHVLLYVGLTLSFTFLMYLIIGHLILGYSLDEYVKKPIMGIPTGGNFYDWMLMYGHWDKELKWGTFQRNHLFLTSITTFSNALFIHRIYSLKSIDALFQLLIDQNASITIEQFLFSLFLILLLLNLLLYIYFIKNYLYYLGFLLWFVFQSLLVIWWEPTNKEFWITPLFTLILIQFFNVNRILALTKTKLFYYSLYYIINLFFLLWVSLIFVNNYKNFLKIVQYKTFFGHWEDLYDQNQFIHIMNKDLKIPFDLKQDEAFLIKQRLAFIEQLRIKLRKKENEAYFNYYIKQFEDIISALEKFNYEEIHQLKEELNLIKNHYEDWLKIHGIDTTE